MASLLTSPEEKATTLLHDVVEDSTITFDDLLRLGMPHSVVTAVRLLTKRKGEDYSIYLSRVKAHPIAKSVKLADLMHNMDITRLSAPTEKDLERVRKYRVAYQFLMD